MVNERGSISYITSEDKVETLSKKSDSKNDGVAILHNPVYREKLAEFFNEAQRKVMGMVHFYDGSIILIENKIAILYLGWKKKRTSA